MLVSFVCTIGHKQFWRLPEQSDEGLVAYEKLNYLFRNSISLHGKYPIRGVLQVVEQGFNWSPPSQLRFTEVTVDVRDILICKAGVLINNLALANNILWWISSAPAGFNDCALLLCRLSELVMPSKVILYSSIVRMAFMINLYFPTASISLEANTTYEKTLTLLRSCPPEACSSRDYRAKLIAYVGNYTNLSFLSS